MMKVVEVFIISFWLKGIDVAMRKADIKVTVNSTPLSVIKDHNGEQISSV
jgi:hypothetical protein